MPQTLFIDTNALPRSPMTGGGEMTEILNHALAGAKNVVGTLRWLQSGETFTADPLDRHQLLYLMEGQARVTLEGKTHEVKGGMGIYLGPKETASLQGTSERPAKIFHLVVASVPA
jgi:glyoxylate utilization-related uncharacterized protein